MNDKVTAPETSAPAQDFDPTGLSADEMKILSGTDDEAQEETADLEIAEDSFEGDAAAEEAKDPNPAADPNRKPKFVPHAALHQARQELKATQERLRKYEDAQHEIVRKLTEHRAANPEAEAQPDPDAIPNEDENPFEALKWMKKKLEAQEAEKRQREEMSAQERQLNDFRVDVAREFDSEAAVDPDTAESFEYLQQAFKYEFDNVYAKTGMKFEQFSQDIITQHSIFARKHGIPIGQYVKNLAASRGWTPGILAKLKAPSDGGIEKQIERVEKLAQAQDTNITLGRGGGGGSPEITLETLAKMTGEQLEKFVAKNPKAFEKLTGIA